MKEIYRLNFDQVEKGYDLIFIPKKNVVDISFEKLESAMLHIMNISKVIKKESGKNG
jgi:ribonuclease P protein component